MGVNSVFAFRKLRRPLHLKAYRDHMAKVLQAVAHAADGIVEAIVFDLPRHG